MTTSEMLQQFKVEYDYYHKQCITKLEELIDLIKDDNTISVSILSLRDKLAAGIMNLDMLTLIESEVESVKEKKVDEEEIETLLQEVKDMFSLSLTLVIIESESLKNKIDEYCGQLLTEKLKRLEEIAPDRLHKILEGFNL